MSMVLLSATSGEGENIFAPLIKVLFVYLDKTENIRMRKKPHTFPGAQHTRTGFFIHQSQHFQNGMGRD